MANVFLLLQLEEDYVEFPVDYSPQPSPLLMDTVEVSKNLNHHYMYVDYVSYGIL